MEYQERLELIRKAFKDAPATFVPALTIEAMRLSLKAGCWAEGGMSMIAKRVELTSEKASG